MKNKTFKEEPEPLSDPQIAFLERIHQSLINGIRSFKAVKPKEWLAEHGLTSEASGACFHSGQIHHSKPKEFIAQLISVGFLKPSTDERIPSNKTAYTCFGDYAMVFPLRNEKDQVVNLFSIGLKKEKEQFLNNEGIYPCYPKPQTKTLILVPTIMDAATVIQAGVLEKHQSVMALFEGELLPHQQAAIDSLPLLERTIRIVTTKSLLNETR